MRHTADLVPAAGEYNEAANEAQLLIHVSDLAQMANEWQIMAERCCGGTIERRSVLNLSSAAEQRYELMMSCVGLVFLSVDASR